MPNTPFYQNPDFWSGAGALGAGIGGLFGGGQNNPADAGMPYLEGIPKETGKYLDPYFNAGRRSSDTLEGQYNDLINNPGGKMNDIGKNFQQSPGFQFALQQALQGGNQAAAAGGMVGSPMNQQNNMATATQLGNQDYNNWIQRALGMYGEGLHGHEGMANRGLNAGTNQANNIAQTRAAQAKLAYEGQMNQNANQGSSFGDIASGIAKIAPLFFV